MRERPRHDERMAAVGEAAGPRIAEAARKVRADIAALLGKEPAAAAVDWYHERGARALSARRPVLAIAYFEEAGRLGERRADRHRRGEAEAKLAQARQLAVAKERSP